LPARIGKGIWQEIKTGDRTVVIYTNSGALLNIKNRTAAHAMPGISVHVEKKGLLDLSLSQVKGELKQDGVNTEVVITGKAGAFEVEKVLKIGPGSMTTTLSAKLTGLNTEVKRFYLNLSLWRPRAEFVPFIAETEDGVKVEGNLVKTFLPVKNVKTLEWDFEAYRLKLEFLKGVGVSLQSTTSAAVAGSLLFYPEGRILPGDTSEAEIKFSFSPITGKRVSGE
jgi:hypothetical protein